MGRSETGGTSISVQAKWYLCVGSSLYTPTMRNRGSDYDLALPPKKKSGVTTGNNSNI